MTPKQQIKNLICKRHKPKNKELGYVAWQEWMDIKIRNKAKQYQCKKCKRWFFKSEL